MQPNNTSRDVLLALRERVLAAKGADRELDALLLCALVAPEDAYVLQSPINAAWCIYAGHEARSGLPRLWSPRGDWHRPEGWPLTASADATMALLERDPAYKADPEYFLTECMVHAPARDFDYTKPSAPQAARHMLAGYLGAKAALAGGQTHG